MTVEPSQSMQTKFGATEIMYLIGLLLLFAGAWIWFDLGRALALCGSVLVLTSWLNSWMQHREELSRAAI